MSLKCSLFGHNYGDTERRRDREETGTELVETTRDVKACTRCGETLVVSEATEVTTLQTAGATAGAGADADRRGGTGTGPDDRTGAGQQDGTDTRPRAETDTVRRDRTDTGQRDGTDTGQADGAGRGRARAETGRRDGQSTAGRREEQIKQVSTQDSRQGDTPRGGEDGPRTGAATGAEAVGQGGADGGAEPSDADTSDSTPGSLSGRSEVGGSGPAGETGTADTADTRSRESRQTDTQTEDAPPSQKNDAFIIDENGKERRPTEWPGTGHEDGNDTPGAEDWEPAVDTEDSDTPPEPATRSTTGHTVPEGEFYCPECEFTTLVEFASSLREGDFCPECHRAALEHRSE